MKSIFLVLIACVAVINSETVQTKDLTTDFLIDNILNPMLQAINQNSINYLLQQLLGGLLGKRDINDVISHLQTALNQYKDQIQEVLNALHTSVQNLIMHLSGSKDLTTDFLIDNILNPMLQAINQNSINYLLQQLLGGLLGKRDAEFKGLTTDFIMDNIINPMLQAINQNSLTYLLQQLLSGKRDAEFKGLTTDFIMDNIINPMLQAINQNSLTYLLQQLLSGKRDVDSKDFLNQLNTSLGAILNDLGTNLLQSIAITGQSIIPILGELGNNILGNGATSIEQLNALINQLAASLSG